MSSLIVWPSWPPPEPLANPLYSAASPGLPVNTIFQGDFYSLAGCTAHISFSASCKHTHTAKAASLVSLTFLSSYSIWWPSTCYILGLSSQGQGKVIFYPLPLLLLSGANPVFSARNGFVPFLICGKLLISLTSLVKHTPTQPPAFLKCPSSWFIHADGLSSGFFWRESIFALRWSVSGIRFLWWPCEANLYSPCVFLQVRSLRNKRRDAELREWGQWWCDQQLIIHGDFWTDSTNSLYFSQVPS